MIDQHLTELRNFRKLVTDLSDALAHLSTAEDLRKLLQIIRRKYWTTPAEYQLVTASLAAIRAQAIHMNSMRGQLIRGCDLVASSMDPIPPHHIEVLEKQITDVSAALANLNTPEDFRHLIEMIHRPGWTTLAELALVTGMLKLLKSQMSYLKMAKSRLISGSELVASTQDPVPPAPHARLEEIIMMTGDAFTHMSTGDDLSYLIQIIRRKYWTTPAEFQLVTTIIDAINTQALASCEMRTQILKGSELVASSQDPIPPKHIEMLEKQITDVSDALAHLNTPEDYKHLIVITRRKGWTTPAELALATSIVEGMRTLVVLMQTALTDVVKGSDLVSETATASA